MFYDGYVMGGVLILLIFLRVPVAFALLLSVLGYAVFNPSYSVIQIAQRTGSSLDSFVLSAVPLFVLLGTAMDRTGIANSLVKFARALCGWVPGGLAHTNVLSSMFFGGISGSGLADVVANGSILIPAMKRAGYPGGFAAALTAASCLIGPVIPPSIALIVYGSLADVSVGRLFIAGIIPGITMGVAMMIYVFAATLWSKYPRDEIPTFRTLVSATREALPVLVLPAVIVLGIVYGVFTATETAAVAACYALVLSLIIARVRSFAVYKEIFVSSALFTGSVLIVVAGAHAFGYVLTVERIPQNAALAIVGMGLSPNMALLMIGLVMLAAGFFLSLEACIVLLTPVFVPMAMTLGIDLIHLGIWMVVTLAIGQLTPPVAIALLASARIANISPHQAFGAAVPFVLLLIAVSALLAVVPALTTWLPNQLMGASF